MPVGTMEYYSTLLQTRTFYSVILPYADIVGPPPYGVLLMLHGKYGNHLTWIHNSRLVLYAEYCPLMVVLPDGGNSRWTNEIPGQAYESWVMDEMRTHIDQTYNMRTDVPWALGGMSMGAYGALHLALKYPEKFSSVYAHSSGRGLPGAPRAYPVDEAVLQDEDLYKAAEAVMASGAQLPRLTFDCGTEDWVVKHNRELHEHFERIGLPHTYHEFPGGHDWNYWDAQLKEALRQHVEVFGGTWRDPNDLPADKFVITNKDDIPKDPVPS